MIRASIIFCLTMPTLTFSGCDTQVVSQVRSLDQRPTAPPPSQKKRPCGPKPSFETPSGVTPSCIIIQAKE